MNNKKTHCRLCLIECTNQKPISIFKEDGEDASFVELILKYLCFQIEPNDTYSTVICQNCSGQLRDFHNFCLYIKRCQFALDAVTKKQNDMKIKSGSKPSFETLLFVRNDEHRQAVDGDEDEGDNYDDNDDDNDDNIDANDETDDHYVVEKDETYGAYEETFKTFWANEEAHKISEYDENSQEILYSDQDPEIARILNYTDMDDRHCIVCDKVFKNYNVLKGHMYNTHKDIKPYTCKICRENVRSKRALRFHLITVHKFKLPKEKLDYLNKIKEERLQLELSNNNDSQAFETSEEHNYSKDKDIVETPEDIENRTCPICEKTMKNFGVLKTHMVIVHKDIKMFSCEFCGQQFRLNRYLKYHLRVNKECGQYIVEEKPPKNILLQHHAAHPLEDLPELNLTCAVCEREFKSIIALKSHMSSSHRGSRPYDCDVCGLAFSLRPSLQRHFMKEEKCLKKKLSKKKYVAKNLVSISEYDPENKRCAICKTMFKTVMLLRAHMFKKHKDNHPFVCQKCGQKFRLRISLKRHHFKDTKCTPEEERKPKKRPTDPGIIEDRTCGVCEAICKTPNALKAHMFLRHRGIKPFSCEHCDMEFGLRRSWTRHLKRSHFNVKEGQQKAKEEDTEDFYTKRETPDAVEVRWSFELQQPNEYEEEEILYEAEDLIDENSSNIDVDSLMLELKVTKAINLEFSIEKIVLFIKNNLAPSVDEANTTKTGGEEDPLLEERLGNVRDVGNLAVWSLSSCKPGFGVERLRDNTMDTYWQSDGVLPHLVNIQFHRKTNISQIYIYTDYKLDESYTPSRISIRSGSHFNDLQELQIIDLTEPTGWVNIPIKDGNAKSIRTFMLQIAVISNHQNGRDTHMRQIRIHSPVEGKNYPLETFGKFSTVGFQKYVTMR